MYQMRSAMNIAKYEMNPPQLQAIEMKAVQPNISYPEMAKEIGVHLQTIKSWFARADFNEAIYDRFMEVSGHRLPVVLDAMLREAEQGNVQAGQLILKHFGKLQDNVTIKIESPFEKFLKIGEVTEAEYEESPMDVLERVAITEVLPERNISNDNPKRKVRTDKKDLEDAKRVAYKRLKERERVKRARGLRLRAKAVGLALLPSCRQSNHKRKLWLKKLERLEKNLNKND